MARDPLDVIIDDVDSILSSVSEKEFNGKRVLITGASGLLGFYFTALFRRLCEMGGGPIKVDLVVHSAPIRVLSRLANFPGASILIGDLTNAEFLSKLEQYDYIVHAAGYGQPGRFMENQIKTIQLNTTTTIQLFNNLAIGGRYLFVSTSELYSGLSNPPFVEEQIGNTNTTHARACYIEAKRCGEAICNAYRKQGVAAVSARLALAYGPGTKANDQRVLNSFIQRGLTNGQIELRDMGKAQRTYCYVANAVEILFNIMRNGSHPVYNVGGISRTTILGLAESIGQLLGVSVKLPELDEDLMGAPDDVQLDMAKYVSEFGSPNYLDIKNGLARTIEWQSQMYGDFESSREFYV